MRNFLNPGLRRLAATCPVTTAIIAVAVGLWLGAEVWGIWLPKGVEEARGRLGAVGSYHRLQWDPVEGRMVPVPQMSGPFDLWDGQWWRVPISGFHHGGILHLVMNCLGIVALGRLLEPRMGRTGYAAFFLSATAFSMLPEFLLENQAVGLSGAIFAMFGALLVLRTRDWQVAEVMTPSVVQFGFVWLVGCVVATQLDVIHIANAAHFTGLAYGWLAGQVYFGRFAARGLARWIFVSSHLALVPGFYFVSHPFWGGRYQWYLAFGERQLDRRAEFLQKAVQRDPSLRRAWDQLSEVYLISGDRDRAWRTLLEGLKRNRSNEHGMQQARILWQHFVASDSQAAAREVVEDVFGDDAAAWQQRLEEPPGDPRSGGHVATVPSGNSVGAKGGVEGDGRLAPIEKVPGRKRDLSAPPVNPDAPDSAAEGVRL